MICPTCGNRLAVLDTRGVVRTRACAEGHRWQTEEVICRDLTRDPDLTPSAATVLATLAHVPLTVMQLRQQLPAMAHSTIKRALTLLIDTQRAHRQPGGYYAHGAAPDPETGRWAGWPA